MLRNPSVKSLINNSVVARYKITPVPKDLSQSLAIYSYFSKQIGGSSTADNSIIINTVSPSLVEYKQDRCPITKQYLEGLRLVLYDPLRLKKSSSSTNAGSPISPDGHIIGQNKLRSDLLPQQTSSLTPLEQLLINIDSIKLEDGTEFSLDLVLLSRNADSITMARNSYTTSKLGTLENSANLNDAVIKSDLQYQTKLKGLIELFERSATAS